MRTLAVIAVGAAMIGSAHAQDTSGTGQKDPCQTDASRFCKDAVPDEAKIAACLKANRAKLSAICKKSFDARIKAKSM